MRDLRELERFRWVEQEQRIYGGAEDPSREGLFRMEHRGRWLFIIASTGDGWDHLSISTQPGLPNWYDMEYVKRLFFRPDETAMQLHVPPDQHINCCENCLHLWRPQGVEIPRPPAIMVGPSL